MASLGSSPPSADVSSASRALYRLWQEALNDAYGPVNRRDEVRLRARGIVEDLRSPAAAAALRRFIVRVPPDTYCLRMLIDIDDEAALRTADALLRHPDPSLRLQAFKALNFSAGGAPGTSARDLLLAKLDDPDFPDRAEAASWLAYRIRNTGPVPGFERFASDPDPMVRRHVAASLAWRPTGAQLPVVRRLLHDPDPDIRMAAVRSLGNTRIDVLPLQLSPPLDDPDPKIRLAALEVLSSRAVADPAVAPALIRAASEPAEPAVRRLALLALGAQMLPQAEPLLIESLSDPSPLIRSAAATALGRIWARRPARGRSPVQGDMSRAAVALQALLGDSNRDVRIAAVSALCGMDWDPAAPLMFAAMESSDDSAARSMLWALRNTKSPAVIPFLKDIYADKSSPFGKRAEAGHALAAIEGVEPYGLRRIASSERWERYHDGYAYPDNPYLGFSVAPAAFLARSGIDSDLEVDDPGAWELTITSRMEDVYADLRFGYTSFSESTTSASGRSYTIGVDVSDQVEVMRRADARRKRGFCWSASLSGRLAVIDMAGGVRDMVALGPGIRVGAGFLLWHNIALEMFADAYGYIGFDGDGAQAAASGAAGFSLMYSF